ncbi:MAG: hypothetical protein U9Q03_00575 [Patescibacteria group bacterium]|nr:hypothetical protein [Patescibacteria group bacterium]
MGTMADALAGARLISDDAKAEIDRQERGKAQPTRKYKREKGAEYGFAQLEGDISVKDFRETAKALLLQDSSFIGEIISLAQRFNGEKGGKNLLWRLYTARDELRKREHPVEIIICRMLSRKVRPLNEERCGRKRKKARR